MILMNEEEVFKDTLDLNELVKQEGYSTFEIGESVTYDGSEINDILEEELFNPSDSFISHVGEHDGVTISLLTTDYSENVSARYRPIMLLSIGDDNEDAGKITILKDYRED
jgi:hypothetical protein